jgi:hypothetical protein
METDRNLDMQSISMRLLREFLLPSTSLIPAVPQNLQPVVVRPTAAQIAAASIVETVAAEEMCAVCQDTIVVGTDARTLTFCEHSFHTACIDTWFTTNVRCPVCRHDIRERD